MVQSRHITWDGTSCVCRAGFLLKPLFLSPRTFLGVCGRKEAVGWGASSDPDPALSVHASSCRGPRPLCTWLIPSKATPSNPTRRDFTPCLWNGNQTEAQSVWAGEDVGTEGAEPFPPREVAGCASALLSPAGFWAPSFPRGSLGRDLTRRTPTSLEPLHARKEFTQQTRRRVAQTSSLPTVQPGPGWGALSCPKHPAPLRTDETTTWYKSVYNLVHVGLFPSTFIFNTILANETLLRLSHPCRPALQEL